MTAPLVLPYGEVRGGGAMTFGSLFSGIGGIDLGLERAGMQCLWQVEIDDYANRVLAKHWPDVPRFRDVREVGAHNLPPVDLIAGGFPCQDISNAGRRAGIDGERSGLWSEYIRIVREVRPRFVLVENVAALLARGLGRVLGDLAASGYDAEWDCIPAAAVGAPHRRDRLFLVAYAQRDAVREQSESERWGLSAPVPGFDGESGDVAYASDDRSGWREQLQESGEGTGNVAHAHGQRLQERRERHGESKSGLRAPFGDDTGRRDSDVAHATRPRQSIFQGREADAELAGFRAACGAGWWGTEPDVGRVAHGVPSRVDRLRCLGNAVVPQVAEFIGRRIMAVAR